MYLTADEIRLELTPVQTAPKGTHVSIPVPAKIRPSDKLFLLTEVKE